MRSVGEEIFWRNANGALHDMGMPWLDPSDGAAVEILRWCLLLRSRPTHHRQRFLETDAPALLAYLETLHSKGEALGWRTLEERVRIHAQVLREERTQPCPRPWLAAIWHTLPELAALGQILLDRVAERQVSSQGVALSVGEPSNASKGTGDDETGSAGKAGSGTLHRPRPSPRLAFPAVPVVISEAEKKALDLDDGFSAADQKADAASDDPERMPRPKPRAGGSK